MNDLARPSLYGSYHAILPVGKARRGKVTADVVGPICESGISWRRTGRCRPVGEGISSL